MLFVIKSKLSVLGKKKKNTDQDQDAWNLSHLLSFWFMTCLFKLQSQVGEGRCFSVNCSEKAKEQALQVLKHFNVQVTLEDIFSRCQVGQVLSKLKAMLTHHPFTAGTASTPTPCWGFALSAMCLVPKISA